ncbi:MAG: hypothetical protein D4R83_05520 [Streptomycetaceae bacterium]|nr:MAG: hypothetical protein D4R83_05520 [Streptomycetaceae bacterium]
MAFKLWVMIMGVVTVCIGTTYLLVQQQGRMSMNDPLISLVQVERAQIGAKVSPGRLAAGDGIDLSINEGAFVTFYGLDKSVIATSATLAGKALRLPAGALDNIRIHGHSTVTWQPTSALRFATYTEYVPNFGYISAAQSLKQVEIRASRNVWLCTAAIVAAAIIAAVGLTL